MNSIINRLKSSNITKLTIGSIIAQAIAIIVSPMTTRLYTPEQLGTYTLLLTVVNLFAPIICAKFDMAIITEKEEKNIYAVMVLSFITTIIFSTIVTILYIIYLVVIQQNLINYIGYLIMIYFILILNGIANILMSYNNRNEEYETISKVYMIRAIIQNVGLIIFGVFKFSVIGMVLSQLLGCLFGIKKQAKNLIPNINKFKEIRKEDIKSVYTANKKLMIYTTPANLLNASSYSLLNFFINALYGEAIFGYYSLSYRMLGLPLSIISLNVSKVFFEKATKEESETKGFINNLKSTTKLMTVISIIIVISLITLSPFVFKIVFGQNWEIAGEYVQILAVMYGIRMIVTTVAPAILIAKKQSLEIKLQAIFLIALVGTYLVCKINQYSIEIFLLLICILYSIIYIAFYSVIYKLSKKNIK